MQSNESLCRHKGPDLNIQLVAVEYVGNKVRASDNVAESGVHW